MALATSKLHADGVTPCFFPACLSLFLTLVWFQLELFPVLSSTKHQLSLQPGTIREGFPGGTVMKNPPANAGDVRDVSSIPGSGRSPGGGDGNPLQYSCLENFMDRGAWWVTFHGIAKSQTGLNDYTFPFLPSHPHSYSFNPIFLSHLSFYGQTYGKRHILPFSPLPHILCTPLLTAYDFLPSHSNHPQKRTKRTDQWPLCHSNNLTPLGPPFA